MAFTFNSNPASEAFGKAKKVVYSSDYLENKKAKLAYCEKNPFQNHTISYPCNKLSRSNSFEHLYLFNRGRFINDIVTGRIAYFNKDNLEINLYTKENLTNVNIIEGNPPTANPSPQQINFTTYRIDPCGQLFGNSQCGVENFANYLQLNTTSLFNPPTNIQYAPPLLYPPNVNC